jgi:hypothetical protein
MWPTNVEARVYLVLAIVCIIVALVALFALDRAWAREDGLRAQLRELLTFMNTPAPIDWPNVQIDVVDRPQPAVTPSTVKPGWYGPTVPMHPAVRGVAPFDDDATIVLDIHEPKIGDAS